MEYANQTITFCGVGSHHKNSIVERKFQTLTLGSRKLLLCAKRYWPEAVTPMLWTYELKAFEEKLNVLKLDDDEITPMEKFSGTTTDIKSQNHHTWGCTVYVLDTILQVNISEIPTWEPHSCAGIYLGHPPFHAGQVDLVLNPSTVHVSPQFHVVFDDEF